MYLPRHFDLSDSAHAIDLIRSNPFATVISHDGKESFASHIPVLYRSGNGPQASLVAHLARANPQWRHFERDEEVLAIFQGPHAYVSPTWYATQPAVPTWNYAAVHVYGIPRIISEHEPLLKLLDEFVETFEAPRTDRWSNELPAEFREKMMAAIVGFEIVITRIEAKFKLSQNRSLTDVEGVISALANSDRAMERDLSELMRKVAIRS